MKKKLLAFGIIMGILSVLELFYISSFEFESQLAEPLLSIGTAGILISLLIFLHVFVFVNWRGTEE